MRQITLVLESIRNPKVIEGFIKRQDVNGCMSLLEVLRYVDKETESQWLKIYNDLMRL